MLLSIFSIGSINKMRVDAYWPETYWLLTTFPNILILKKIPGNLDGCYDTIAKKGGLNEFWRLVWHWKQLNPSKLSDLRLTRPNGSRDGQSSNDLQKRCLNHPVNLFNILGFQLTCSIKPNNTQEATHVITLTYLGYLTFWLGDAHSSLCHWRKFLDISFSHHFFWPCLAVLSNLECNH